MIAAGISVAVVGQNGISFVLKDAPSHMKAFQTSLHPLRMRFDIGIFQRFLRCARSETLRDGLNFLLGWVDFRAEICHNI